MRGCREGSQCPRTWERNSTPPMLTRVMAALSYCITNGYNTIRKLIRDIVEKILFQVHESSVGLSSTTNPSLGVAIPVPAQTHLYTHAKGRAT